MYEYGEYVVPFFFFDFNSVVLSLVGIGIGIESRQRVGKIVEEGSLLLLCLRVNL